MASEVFSLVPPYGDEIDLKQKQRPIHEKFNSFLHNTDVESPLVVTRGHVDVSNICSKLLDPKNACLWEDDYHAVHNVQITRPAHDNWGIKKIIFYFCDDFMQKVYDFPWARDPEWSALLQPIYDALNLSHNQIIRALFASMPSGAVIPVHHDTGVWVRRSHRVHVAIDTSDEVEFLVGPTPERLSKVTFAAGAIIELNNQAKHAVTNHMNRPRIHFIFDYMDKDDIPLPRTILRPGAIVRQTRRSIDLQEDYGKRPMPSYIILGAQKCGTTSLFELISQHSLALKGRRRESHYLDWYWNKSVPTPSKGLEAGLNHHDDEEIRDYYSQHYKNYSTFFQIEMLKTHPSLFSGESTPSYLLHGDVVIPRIQVMMPWIKLFVILRNPVDRAFSQYNMCIDATGTEEQLRVRGQSQYIGKSFEEVIVEEMKELQSLGIHADMDYESFSKKYLASRPMGHGGHSLLARGMYHLQLRPFVEIFPLKKQLMVLSIDDIKGSREKIQETMNHVFSFLGVPSDDIADTEAKNTRSYNIMSPETRRRLEEFYQPYNERLELLLGRKFDWSA